MERPRVVVAPDYKKARELNAPVEKYKQPGIKLLGGNKNERWLRLDLDKRELIYFTMKEIGVNGKKIPFDSINNILVDLSKAGKFKVEFLSINRCYKFKFLNSKDFIEFMDALQALRFSNDGSPLFKVTEDFLKTMINLKTEFLSSTSEVQKPQPISLQNTQKSSQLDKPIQEKMGKEDDWEKELKPSKDKVNLNGDEILQTNTRPASAEKGTHKNEVDSKNKEKIGPKADSTEMENANSHKKEVVKNRRNV